MKEKEIIMRLAGIHKLKVEDIGLLNATLSEDEAAVGGNRKNEDSPVAKGYHSTGKSQAQIADELGVDQSTVSRYKSKDKSIKRRPSFDTLKRLASVVGSPSKMFPELGK
jgi:hypothetical protein